MSVGASFEGIAEISFTFIGLQVERLLLKRLLAEELLTKGPLAERLLAEGL